MGFLKVLGTVICSILLFLALTVFSVAFLVNSTILNADFVNSQVDKLDISSIADDTIIEEINKEIPADAEFLRDLASEIIAAEEPLIKTQIRAGIDEAYSYFLEKDSSFSITFSLVEIKQGLKDTLWQTAVDYLKEQLAGISDAEVDRYVENLMTQIPEDSLPRALALLPDGLRHDVIKQYLKELGDRGIFEGTSFGLDFLVEDQVRDYFEGYFDGFIQDIPDSYTIDETTISPEALDAFHQAQKVIDYFQLAYVWLIVAIIVLAGLIFLINWSNIRASMRALGIDLLVFGVLDLAGILLARNLRPEQFSSQYLDSPAALRNWVEGLITDVTGIMLWFSIGVLIIGAALTAVSFVIKTREAAE